MHFATLAEREVLYMKKVTVKDIAVKANVSPTTVSLILNGRGNAKFSEETCTRVLDVSRELGYIPRRTMQSMNYENRVLVAIAPTLSNTYYVNMIDAMQSRAKELGYSLLMFNTFREKQQENRIMQICREYPFAGVFLLYPLEDVALQQQTEWNKPVVRIIDKGIQKNADVLELDSFQIGTIIGEHLIELGHKRVAFISANLESKQVARIRRLEGLREAYRAHGFDPVASVTPYSPEQENLDRKIASEGYDLGYFIAQRLLERNENVTAFVTANDMISVGVLDAIADAGKKVPGDYSVCGCDNTPVSKYRGIALTTVESYAAQTGHEALNIMVRRIESSHAESLHDRKEQAPNEVMRIEYIPKLVIRKSTGPNREKNAAVKDSVQK